MPLGRGGAIRRAVLNYQSGGTQLDPSVLCPQLDQADPSLVILLSDGDIYNWDSVGSRIMSSLSRHQVFFIKLFSAETDTSRDMRNAGIAVATVEKDEDLSTLMVDVTAKTFEAVKNRQNLWNY